MFAYIKERKYLEWSGYKRVLSDNVDSAWVDISLMTAFKLRGRGGHISCQYSCKHDHERIKYNFGRTPQQFVFSASLKAKQLLPSRWPLWGLRRRNDHRSGRCGMIGCSSTGILVLIVFNFTPRTQRGLLLCRIIYHTSSDQIVGVLFQILPLPRRSRDQPAVARVESYDSISTSCFHTKVLAWQHYRILVSVDRDDYGKSIRRVGYYCTLNICQRKSRVLHVSSLSILYQHSHDHTNLDLLSCHCSAYRAGNML